MATEKSDVASPLADVFSGGAAETSSSSSDSSDESAETSNDSQKDESSSKDGAEKLPADKSDESEGVKSPSDEKKSEEKAAEKSATDSKEEKLKKGDEEKGADKAAPDAKAADDLPFKQRFEDTRKWAQDLNNQNSQMRQVIEQQAQQMAILQKKMEGTWTDEDEAASRGPQVTHEDVATRGVQVGKALASKAAAIREFGDESVTAGLTEFHQLFSTNKIVQAAVAEAESPVHAALDIIDRFKFEQKYGRTPKDWRANLTTEIKKELEGSLRKSILEEIKVGKSKQKDTPETLAGKGSGDRADSSGLKEESPARLSSIFN